MSREHPNFLRSEIKSMTGINEDDHELFRKKIVRTFMDPIEGNAKRHDYDSRLIREFNNKCEQNGHTGLLISPTDAGLTYTGFETGVPTGIFKPPAHTGNLVVNPDFTGYGGTTGEPNKYDKLLENFNGSSPSTVGNNSYQLWGPWYQHSPLFTNTVDFKSIIGINLMSNESYNLLDDGQVIGYGDEGASNFPSSVGAQKRVLKMFGQGGTINDFNKVFDRALDGFGSFTTTPMTSITNNGASGSGVYHSGSWVKYELTQRIDTSANSVNSIPAGATGVVFGCYVKVPKDDPLRERNFGGVNITRSAMGNVYVDVVEVKGSNFFQTGISQDGTYTTAATGPAAAYNWGNGRDPASSLNLTPPFIGERWGQGGTRKRLHQAILQDDAREWTPISGTFKINDVSFGSSMNFSIFYAENHTYLESDGVSAGSIHFAQPFMFFK